MGAPVLAERAAQAVSGLGEERRLARGARRRCEVLARVVAACIEGLYIYLMLRLWVFPRARS